MVAHTPSWARGLAAVILALIAAIAVIVGLTASGNDVSAVEAATVVASPVSTVAVEVPAAPPLSDGEANPGVTAMLSRLRGDSATTVSTEEAGLSTRYFHERLVRSADAVESAATVASASALESTTSPEPAAFVNSAPEAVPDQVAGLAVVAPDLVTTSFGSAEYEQRGRAALARIPYDPASIGYTVSFHPWRPGPRGLTHNDRRHIEIFVEPTMPEHLLVHVIAHELGHAVDLALNSQADEDRWRVQRGISPETPWWPTPAVSDFATPAGDFAECFAWWLVGSGSRSTLGDCGSMAPLVAELSAG